jgi:hypothetical protein
MVYGATPTLVSSAVLAIASLTYPEPASERILPFLAVTDPRFEAVTAVRDAGLIAGFSNPIALQRSAAFDLVFTTGLGDKRDGLPGPSSGWSELVEYTSSEIRHLFYFKNCRVVEAIGNCVAELRKVNPYAEFAGQVEVTALSSHLAKQHIVMTMSPTMFAVKLLRSGLFARIWKERCTVKALAAALRGFSMDRLCAGMDEHELVNMYSLVRQIRRKCAGNRELEPVIDRDLVTITLHIASDLILAPLPKD